MPKRTLLDTLKLYEKDHPEFKKIIGQLNIDQEVYLDALAELRGEDIIYMPPLANSTCLNIS